MSGLEVSGGFGYTVTTDAMRAAQGPLRALAARASEHAAALGPLIARAHERAVSSRVPVLRAGMSPTALDHELTGALGGLNEVADAAERLADALLAAASEYERAEQSAYVSAYAGGGSPGVRWGRQLGGEFELMEPVLLWLARGLPGTMLEESRVVVRRVRDGTGSTTADAPSGFGELAARVPTAGPGKPQLRIERYDLPGGERRWIVYLSGTSEWSPFAGPEPFDVTSDGSGLAGESAGSTRATEQALRAAGWKPGDAVMPVGHSQGGIVAAALAAGGASVPLMVTFGSPTAGVSLPNRVHDVVIEHDDDPVPPIGGPASRAGGARLLVREPGPTAAQAAHPAKPVAHAMEGYRATAQRMDASPDSRIGEARDEVRAFTQGQPAEVTLWRGERAPELSRTRDDPAGRGSAGGR